MSINSGTLLEELRKLPVRPSGAHPLEVRVTRGDCVESVHQVHAVVCDPQGKMVHQWGDIRRPVFPRSAVKPMQALPFFWNGSHVKLNLTKEEIAIACASHHGEDSHLRLVKAWLDRLDLSEKNLECGAHYPYDEKSTHQLIRGSHSPSCLHNNCSGKHTGMLMGCQVSKEKTSGYTSYHHPWQEKIRKSFQKFFDVLMDDVPWGVDGCGVPTYHLPLHVLAKGIARLAQGSFLDEESSDHIRKMNQAILDEPFYLGGTQSLCTKILQVSEGKAIAKVGAEGIYAAWLPKENLGIALKSEDGSSRGSEIAILKILELLGIPLAEIHSERPILRWTNDAVGAAYCS